LYERVLTLHVLTQLLSEQVGKDADLDQTPKFALPRSDRLRERQEGRQGILSEVVDSFVVRVGALDGYAVLHDRDGGLVRRLGVAELILHPGVAAPRSLREFL